MNPKLLDAGDFWHVRGPLAVKPLNEVTAELQTWTQPTVILVGNHDQVSVGGLEHALPLLAAACRSMVLIDRPSIFMNALWLPYRRDTSELKTALQQAGQVKAVFAHADVVGLLANCTITTRRDNFSPACVRLGTVSENVTVRYLPTCTLHTCVATASVH